MSPDLPTRPGRLQLREPSPSSAPHSPLTLARAAEPGNRDRCCCRMPSGPSATGDRGRALAAAEDAAGGRAGGRRRASSPVAAETPWEPKVWQSEGRGPGGGGSASRPAPPLPAPLGPTVPTGERPPPARHGSALGALQVPFCLGLVLRSATGLQEEMALTEGPLAPTGPTEPYLGALY